jgi:hypothetical protein
MRKAAIVLLELLAAAIGLVAFYIGGSIQVPPPPLGAGIVLWGFPRVWRMSAGGGVGQAIFQGNIEFDLVFWVGLSLLIVNVLLVFFRRAPTRN